MDFKKFATWEYLIPAGLCLWIIIWLVTFLAVFVRLVAALMIAVGVADLILSLIKKNKTKDNPEQPKKENGQN